jgi:hypothetical protein
MIRPTLWLMAATYHPSVCGKTRYAARKRASFAFISGVFAWLAVLVPAGFAAPKNPSGPATPVIVGKEGWLFLPSELRFLQFPTFWGEIAKTASHAGTPETADPLKAIENFHQQLRAAGIRLVVVPVPPKALALRGELPGDAAARVQVEGLPRFFEELRARDIEHVNLLPVFTAAENSSGAAFYCKTDSHWSGMGCVAAAKAIAAAVRPSLEALPKAVFRQGEVSVHFRGDLSELSGAQAPAEESLSVRQISTEQGQAVQPDMASPLLLLGDSHTLVFHDFLAERAGLLDQLAAETGIVPDLIGTRGSGANAVRVSLLRRSVKDPGYLTSKKVVVWCFAAREFTEADQGWQSIPLKK